MNKKLIFAVLVFLVLAGLSGCAVRERTAIDTRNDSYVWGGGDIIFYSDDHATQKLRVIGETGGLNAGGVITAAGGLVTSGGTGLTVAGNITMSNGALVNSVGPFTVTDQLYVTSQIVAVNGVAVTGNITVGTDLDLAGNAQSTSGPFRINDPLLVTGTLGVSSQINAANGVAATGNVTVTGAGSYSSQLTASNGVAATGNVTVTGAGSYSSQLNANNGLAVAGMITTTAPIYDAYAIRLMGSVLITGGMNIYDPVGGMGATFEINDAVVITGGLTMRGGNFADDGGSLRLNDDTLITGTVNATGVATFNATARVDSQFTAANGIAAAGGITSTGPITVSNWGLFYGIVLQPQLAQVVTASYGITPGNYSVLNLADDGGQATGTIALDTTVSIVSGTHVGQFLLVFWLDADGATLTIQDNGNMQGPANADVVLGYQDSAMFFWDGTDWLCINVTDL